METELTAPIAVWLSERLYWVFLGFMLLNILQRRHHEKAPKKRMATLLIGISIFALMGLTRGIDYIGGSDRLLIPLAAGYGGLLYWYRDKLLPFRLRSARDGRWLSYQEILFDDTHGDGSEME